jgi:phosphate transport system substrate-binding protein
MDQGEIVAMKNRILFALAALLLLVPFMGVMAQEQNIVEIAVGNESFSTLVSLVQAAGLVDVLSGEGPFTVFAPTNDAFAKLPAPVVAYLTSEAGKDTLTSILTYHVVAGKVMSADVTTGDVASVQGSPISIVVDDMGVAVENAMVVTADVEASNGVIHVIDAVILPDIELPEVDPLTVSGDIITAGSSTVFPLTESVAARFNAEGYSGTITVDSIGSGAGFERFCKAGETDISNASRAIRQAEIDNCAALATPRLPIEFRVGTDGLAVVVSGANDFVQDVTKEELAVIFSTAQQWSDVRPEWPAQDILRFIPGTDSGTFDFFVEAVFGGDEAPILAAANTQLSEDDNVLVQGVESSPFAVGFFGYAYYVSEGEKLRTVAINGVIPNTASVEDGSYILARPLFIYSDAGIIADKPQVGEFINFYLTHATEEALKVGYFPASEAALNAARLNLLAAMGMGM